MPNTAFSTLYTNALKMADHPTADTSAQDKIKIFINQSLQELYAGPARRLMEDTGTIPTVANQEWVAIGSITLALNTGAGFSVDEISRIYQTTDDIALERWTIQHYREVLPDVTAYSGNPYAYARHRDRIFLYPRPSSIMTLNLDVWVIAPNLSLDADTSLIIPKHDEAILAGALYRWFRFIESDEINKIALWKGIFDEKKILLEQELNREPDRVAIVESHRRETRWSVWRRLAKSPWGIA